MGPGEALAMMTLFLSIASVVVLRGPLGKALAERISGRAHTAETTTAAEVDRLHTELEDVKARLSEAEERLDFAERLLAKQKHSPPLGPGS